MKIAIKRQHDNNGDRWADFTSGNAKVSILIPARGKPFACWVYLTLSSVDEVKFGRCPIESFAGVRQFIEETYLNYRHLYRLEKS